MLDSGASSHMTSEANHFQHCLPYQGTDSISIANGSTLPIQNSGDGILPLPPTNRKLLLRNLLHVPSISHNLLSIHRLTSDNHCSISFDASGFQIKDLKDNQILLRGSCRNGLYPLTVGSSTTQHAFRSAHSAAPPWHARLGHPHCKFCNMAKSHRLPFSASNHVTTPLQLIHTDVWGPAPSTSRDGYKYYLIFIDDCTRFCWLYLMTTKDEVFSKIQQFTKMLQHQFTNSFKILRSDGGGEYTSTALRSFLTQTGIIHQFSCPHTPEQNGLAERKHRHLLEITRTLLLEATLPYTFWADALLTANYLINRLPSKALHLQIPFQLLLRHPAFLLASTQLRMPLLSLAPTSSFQQTRTSLSRMHFHRLLLHPQRISLSQTLQQQDLHFPPCSVPRTPFSLSKVLCTPHNSHTTHTSFPFYSTSHLHSSLHSNSISSTCFQRSPTVHLISHSSSYHNSHGH
ncbi:Retrovirus-related Pol polyprotein from transposon TNT 1-94 [Dendrobium catenatum]|uniref:Retrovirus-related Pol polyprotein from transposon TNT 1-94 n=1 Tax=Dendrobium catenatum TaxID=906689 RepID=A0A2I0WTV4_9ASPA|nr:Retrovirus-related Pol polyprotein from transposon TNT 1-94 [Dendrobium catenatum]